MKNSIGISEKIAPFFSVITVSYNAENSIANTIRSTLNQTFSDFEIVVKDGKSSDSTIKQMQEDQRIRLYVEKDSGIYDAMNAAINYASGKYFIFMNCGDQFASNDVLEMVYKRLISQKDPAIFYGDYRIGSLIKIQTAEINDFYLYRTPLCHQSMFINRELFLRYGLFNCNYKILADFEFTLHCWREKVPFIHDSIFVCEYLGDGVSESEKGVILKEKERRKILNQYYTPTQCRKFDIILIMSMRKFRIWLMSGNAPEWLMKLYQGVVNWINKH